MSPRAPHLVLLALAACSEPAPEDEPDYEPDPCQGHTHPCGGEEPTECTERVTVLASIDEVSPLGFSAADMLALAVGQHASGARWGHDEASSASVEFTPAAGDTAVTVDLRYSGGEVRFIEADELLLYDFACNDRLEVDIELDLATADGALAERIVAPQQARNPEVVTLSQRIAGGELAGTLDFTVTHPPDAATELAVRLGISPGNLSGGVAVAFGEGVGSWLYDLAAWPALAPCSPNLAAVPLDLALADFTALDVLAHVESFGPVPLTWDDGTTTELTLEFATRGTACGLHTSQFDAYLGGIILPVDLAVSSADGRWQAVLPAHLNAYPTKHSREFEYVQLVVRDERPPGDPLADYGLAGVDPLAYAGTRIVFEGLFWDEYPFGNLGIYGRTRVECDPEDPNCYSTPEIKLVSATWLGPDP